MDKVIRILENAGIKMDVGGCGCCGSPWVKMTYKGELIFDGNEADFTMHTEEPEPEKQKNTDDPTTFKASEAAKAIDHSDGIS